MAISDIEHSELNAPLRQDGFGKTRRFSHFKSKAGKTELDGNYANAIEVFGIKIAGKAYKSQEANIDEYEKNVKGGKWNRDYPTNKPQASFADYESMSDAIDSELANLRRHAQADKAAFRARWDKLVSQLQEYKSKFDKANNKFKEEQKAREKAEQRQDLADIANLAGFAQTSTKGKFNNLPLIFVGVGSLAVIGIFLVVYLKKLKAKQATNY